MVETSHPQDYRRNPGFLGHIWILRVPTYTTYICILYIYIIKLIVNTKRKECHFLKILEPCSTKPRSQLWKPFPSEPVTSPWLKSKPPAQLPEPSPATGSSWMINCTHQNGMNFTYPKLQKFILDVCGNE